MSNSRLTYQYRSGSNYKQAHSVVLAGEVSTQTLGLLIARAEDQIDSHHENIPDFIPGQVGLPDLQEMLGEWDDNEDHPYHEVLGLENTEAAADPQYPSAEEVMSLIARTKWDDTYLPDHARHGDDDLGLD